MALGRPLAELVLSADEAAKLVMMARRPKSDQRTALRAGIVLDCASGAERHKVTLATVGKWRQRFVKQRLAGLGDAPRPGQPRKIDAGQRSAIIYSLVVSCQRHGKDVLAYLRDVLRRLPLMTNQDDLTPLTPSAWQPS